MANKFSKQIFKREMTSFEVYTVLSSIAIGIFSIFRSQGKLIPLLFSFGLLVLVGVFIKNKQRDKVLIIVITTLAWLLILGNATIFTTVFSPQELGQPTQTHAECIGIGGIALNMDCSVGYIEIGNAGEQFICCLPDTCQGTWKRIYNSETKIFEKVCT